MIPSLGALVKGHALLVSRSHSTMILGSGQGYIDQIFSLIHDYSCLLALDPENDVLLCFEHGSETDDRHLHSCGTTHGHVHLVPMTKIQAESILGAAFVGSSEKETSEAILALESLNNYICGAIFEKGRVPSTFRFVHASSYPSQYLRRCVAEYLGLGHWDWKTSKCEKETLATMSLSADENINIWIGK